MAKIPHCARRWAARLRVFSAAGCGTTRVRTVGVVAARPSRQARTAGSSSTRTTAPASARTRAGSLRSVLCHAKLTLISLLVAIGRERGSSWQAISQRPEIDFAATMSVIGGLQGKRLVLLVILRIRWYFARSCVRPCDFFRFVRPHMPLMTALVWSGFCVLVPCICWRRGEEAAVITYDRSARGK